MLQDIIKQNIMGVLSENGIEVNAENLEKYTDEFIAECQQLKLRGDQIDRQFKVFMLDVIDEFQE